jgi:hypothetical protein
MEYIDQCNLCKVNFLLKDSAGRISQSNNPPPPTQSYNAAAITIFIPLFFSLENVFGYVIGVGITNRHIEIYYCKSSFSTM